VHIFDLSEVQLDEGVLKTFKHLASVYSWLDKRFLVVPKLSHLLIGWREIIFFVLKNKNISITCLSALGKNHIF
jgi:hypothetical protein